MSEDLYDKLYDCLPGGQVYLPAGSLTSSWTPGAGTDCGCLLDILLRLFSIMSSRIEHTKKI